MRPIVQAVRRGAAGAHTRQTLWLTQQRREHEGYAVEVPRPWFSLCCGHVVPAGGVEWSKGITSLLNLV